MLISIFIIRFFFRFLPFLAHITGIFIKKKKRKKTETVAYHFFNDLMRLTKKEKLNFCMLQTQFSQSK